MVRTSPAYVVSLDVVSLMNRWGEPKKILSPDATFMAPLRTRLKGALERYFSYVDFLEEHFLHQEMQRHVNRMRSKGFHVVSLEPAYTVCDSVLELTRQVNSYNDPFLSRHARRGSNELRFQMNSLRGKNVVLVDDVIFSGGTIHDLMNELTHFHVIVHGIVAGVAVTKGREKVEKSSFAVHGDPHKREVCVVAEYDNIIDQICERDFLPGVPFSGREAAFPDNYNVPYLLPFAGSALAGWASIPVHEQVEFSVICLQNAIDFWEEVERLNGGSYFSCKDVPRFLKGFPQDGTRFVDCLHRSKSELLSGK